MLPRVYFSEDITEEGIRKLAETIFSVHPFEKDCNVAIKVHIGEELNTLYIKPNHIKPVLDELNKTTKNYFLTDTNTLYSGMRSTTLSHVQLAKEKGFCDLGRFIVADDEEKEGGIKVDLPLFREVKIGKYIADSDAIICISHFKGHDLFGFGGTIKNLGMGCASRSAKLKMHAGVSPLINNKKCNNCGICISICPTNAISSIEEGKKIVDSRRCIGCGMCIGHCPQKTIEFPWTTYSREGLMERCAEHTFGAIKNKKGIYFNYIYNVSSKCDCARDSPLIGKDVGIVASTDPVACEKAAYDLTLEKNGKNIFLESKGNDGKHILDYAERIGLGSLNYDLIKISSIDNQKKQTMPRSNITKKELIDFEKQISEHWKNAEIRAPVHLSGGNEEQLIEIFKEIQPRDYIFSTWRAHYHYLLAGGSKEKLKQMILQGDSMHIFDKELNFISSPIVAGTAGIAAGLAYVLKEKGSKSRVWCFIGDGAEDEGHFYEAVRYVDGHELPCTFIIEDNNRSVETPKEERYGRSEMQWPSCVKRYHYTCPWPHAGAEKGEWIDFGKSGKETGLL